jgi:hypothetical protein
MINNMNKNSPLSYMSIDIDLDIKNYTIGDIEYFFGLDKIQKYGESDIEQRAYEINDQLFSAGKFNTKFKRNFVEFVTTAKQRLINEKITPSRPTLTLIPKNSQLDPVDFPKSESAGRRDQELIEHPDTAPRVYSQPSEFFAGTLNPLNNRIITKCLTVDTRFRDNVTTSKSSDFVLQLPLKLSKVVSMQLSSIELPISFYGISNAYGNNFINMSLRYTNDSGDATIENKTYSIPDGNYSAGDLITLLNTLTGSTDPNPDNPFSYINFSLGITAGGSGTGKVLIHVIPNNNSIIELNIDFTLNADGNSDPTVPITSRFGANLGFIKAKYTGALSYIGESLMQPFSIRYVYLSIDDYNNSVNNHFVTAFNQSILNQNILATIAVKNDYFTLITDNNLKIVTEPREYFGPVDIQRLHIRLLDDHGRTLDMNNTNYSFCLTFKMLYNL